MGAIRRVALCGIVATIACAVGAGQAFAGTGWWHINTISAPAQSSGGKAQIVIELANLGDGPASQLAEELGGPANAAPVTVHDALPSGITATEIKLKGGVGSISEDLYPYYAKCSVGTVSCVLPLPMMPYERVDIVLTVNVEPGAGTGVNEVSVSGGLARPTALRRALTLEAPYPSFGVENYEVTPEEEGGLPDSQAGSHPFQLTTTFTLNTRAHPYINGVGRPEMEPQPLGLTRDLRFKLPPGLIGNPTPLPKCNIRTFTEQALGTQHNGVQVRCPNDTIVGVAVSTTDVFIGEQGALYTLRSPLYALEPAVGEPARFGFTPTLFPVILDTSVRTGGDYGVTVTVPTIPERVEFIGSQVTFWGAPTDPRHDSARGYECLGQQGFHYIFSGEEQQCPVTRGQPLLIMPTYCTAPPLTTIEADDWAEPGVFTPPKEYTFQDSEGEPFALDGCNQLNFEPSINVAPDGQEGSSPSGLTVGVHVDQEANINPRGIAESTVKDTRVTLPPGVALNPAGGDGLMACILSEVGLENPGAPSCPEASKVGTLEISTPLLPNPLVGAAYLAQQNQNPFGSLVALYLVAYDPISGVRIKLAGQVTPDPVTGQLTSNFDETPPLPFEDLKIHFFGGSRAPLSTPSACGSYTTSASIAPWSGNPAVDAASAFQITSGPNHGPCQSPLPFRPSLHVGSANLQAAEFTPFSMTMGREDGEQNLDAITLHMPPGLLGTLAGVELCGEPQADEGLCGPNSQIGETTISVGVGGNPFTVFGGRIYITGPYHGAPYGLSIVNPAKAGPFDVEHDTSRGHEYMPACDCVVVRAKIEVDPTTAALTITSDTTGPYRIPTILDGIPLQIKHVNVTVDRQRFMFNPTNCERMAIGGDLTSAEGASDQLSVPFQVTNCATLQFQPQFSVSTSAHASRSNGTSLHVKLSYPNVPYDKRSNVGKVRVELPKQLPSRLTTLQKACPDSVFNANPESCPAASKVGDAIATTPVIPEDFRGPAYFVSHGGAKFPELIIVLHGYALTVELHGETFISKEGVTSTTFNTLPDVPIGSFELNLPAGPDSALAANGDVCAQKLYMPTTFTAQNGMVLTQKTRIAVEGCAPEIRVIRHRVSGKHATVIVSVPSAGRLTANGGGVVPKSRAVQSAGTVTMTLRLSTSGQRFLARHHGRRLMVPIRLSFSPAHGKRLKAQVAVLMR